jgi:hypothetical protein
MAYAFDSNQKIQQLRAAMRAAAPKHGKPRVTFCMSCGAPIYASATVVLGVAVDGVHTCTAVAS